MAFQTGTQVDPRLMRADLSGFSRGTELAMAGIGAAIPLSPVSWMGKGDI